MVFIDTHTPKQLPSSPTAQRAPPPIITGPETETPSADRNFPGLDGGGGLEGGEGEKAREPEEVMQENRWEGEGGRDGGSGGGSREEEKAEGKKGRERDQGFRSQEIFQDC